MSYILICSNWTYLSIHPSIFESAYPHKGVLEPISGDFGLVSELVASQSQGTYRGEQPYTHTSTPSRSGNWSHISCIQVRWVYSYTISDFGLIYLLELNMVQKQGCSTRVLTRHVWHLTHTLQLDRQNIFINLTESNYIYFFLKFNFVPLKRKFFRWLKYPFDWSTWPQTPKAFSFSHVIPQQSYKTGFINHRELVLATSSLEENMKQPADALRRLFQTQTAEAPQKEVIVFVVYLHMC